MEIELDLVGDSDNVVKCARTLDNCNTAFDLGILVVDEHRRHHGFVDVVYWH